MPTGHRHQAEIRQELGSGFDLAFSVTSVELVRGALVTAHCFLARTGRRARSLAALPQGVRRRAVHPAGERAHRAAPLSRAQASRRQQLVRRGLRHRPGRSAPRRRDCRDRQSHEGRRGLRGAVHEPHVRVRRNRLGSAFPGCTRYERAGRPQGGRRRLPRARRDRARRRCTSWQAANRLVLVHGGAATLNDVSTKLGAPPEFLTSESGHTSRRTDRRTLEIFEMVYCGSIEQGLGRTVPAARGERGRALGSRRPDLGGTAKGRDPRRQGRAPARGARRLHRTGRAGEYRAAHHRCSSAGFCRCSRRRP